MTTAVNDISIFMASSFIHSVLLSLICTQRPFINMKSCARRWGHQADSRDGTKILILIKWRLDCITYKNSQHTTLTINPRTKYNTEHLATCYSKTLICTESHQWLVNGRIWLFLIQSCTSCSWTARKNDIIWLNMTEYK